MAPWLRDFDRKDRQRDDCLSLLSWCLFLCPLGVRERPYEAVPGPVLEDDTSHPRGLLPQNWSHHELRVLHTSQAVLGEMSAWQWGSCPQSLSDVHRLPLLISFIQLCGRRSNSKATEKENLEESCKIEKFVSVCLYIWTLWMSLLGLDRWLSVEEH